jgi:hypothetical protein
MLEAENDSSSTFSSQPSLVCQAVSLDIDEPCIHAVYCCITASTIIMEEHPNAAHIRSRKEAGADPVALTKHYDEKIAQNESFTSDEEDYHPVGREERRLSTTVTPDKICTRLVIRMDSYVTLLSPPTIPG